VPLVNQPLIPDSASPGGSGFTLTVNGTGFVSGSVVEWNGNPRTTSFVSGSQLTASILAADIAIAGTATVTVSNPGPGGGVSNPASFPVRLSAASVFGFISSFTPPVSGSVEIATADFNGDGKLDLALPDGGRPGSVSVLLGNGDGSFQAPQAYATGSVPNNVITGDFNGDGNVDLAVSNLGDNTVSIFLGKGDGTFGPQLVAATGSEPFMMAVGDFNGDGHLDLAVPNMFGNSVSILLGNGDGTFRPHTDYAAGSVPFSVTTGDFNRDGKIDVAVSNSGDGTVSVLLGIGDGTFQPQVVYPANSVPGQVVSADFNGDGKLDLGVTNNLPPGAIDILLGNGDGTFQMPVSYGTFSGQGSCCVVLGDFNGDGILDLGVENDSFFSLLLGNGDGTFQPHLDFFPPPITMGFIHGVAVGDFNRDGLLDLATGSGNGMQNLALVLVQSLITVSLTPPSLSIGGRLVGTTSFMGTVTLTNTGAASLNLTSIAITGTNATDFGETHTCGSTLAPGTSCTIRAYFRPAAKGTQTAALTITDNGAGSPQAVPLTGFGTVINVSPRSLNFGNQPVGTHSAP